MYMFVQVYYLDNLKYDPYVVIPRFTVPCCNVFTGVVIETIAKADTIKLGQGALPYGNLDVSTIFLIHIQ
jgi:hypothetical protein